MLTTLCAAFVAGVLGSSHCVGMCGAFAVMLNAAAPQGRRLFQRQMVYTIGRTSTYVFLGLACAMAGAALKHRLGGVPYLSPLLTIFAGGVLLATGLRTLGWLPTMKSSLFSSGVDQNGRRHTVSTKCGAAREFAAMLREPSLGGAFLAGIANGFLPCGLLYGMLALAGSQEAPLQAAAMMAAFGLGTSPVMLFVGLGMPMLRPAARSRVFALAGCWVLVLGAWSVARGSYSIYAASNKNPASTLAGAAIDRSPGAGQLDPPKCPLCVERLHSP